MADVDLGTIKARIDLDVSTINQRVDEVLEAWKSIQTGTGNLTTDMTRKMVDGVTQYQQKLDIIADKLTKQRQLIQQLQDTANKPITGKNTQAEIEKATAQLEKEKIKLKELEAQFDRTYTSQQDFILSQDKVAKKAEEVNQKMDSRKAGANMQAGTLLASSGLRTFSQVCPGVIGNLESITTQISTAKQAMTGMQSVGMKWAMGLSAAVGVAATLVMAGIKQMQEAEENRRKAFEDGIQKNKEYTESFRTLETNLNIMQDAASSADDVRSAKQALADTFPDLVIGWDNEGNAILANTDKIRENIDAIKEKQYWARQSIIGNSRDVVKSYDDQAKKIAEYSAKIQELQNFVSSDDWYDAKPLPSWDLAEWLGKEGMIGGKDTLAMLQALEGKLADLNIDLLESKDSMRSYYNAMVQEAVIATDKTTGLQTSYDDLTNAQRTLINTKISDHMDDLIAKTVTVDQVVAQLNADLSNPEAVAAATAAAEKQSRLTAILADGYSQQAAGAKDLADACKILADDGQLTDGQLKAIVNTLPEVKKYLEETGDTSLNTGKALADAIGSIDYSGLISELGTLSSAYQTLSDGQQLSVKQLYDLSVAYPEVAAYIEQTNDLTLSEGQILEQVFEIRRQEHIAALEYNRDVAESARQRAQISVESLSTEISAMEAAIELRGRTGNIETGIYSVLPSTGTQSLKERLAEETASLEKYQKDFDAANAKIAAAQSKAASIGSFSGTKSGSGAKRSSASSSAKSNRNEALAAELKQLEQKKKMDQLTSEEEIAWLERVQSKYKMNADEKYDLEYRLYSARKKYEQELEQAATERLNAEYKAIDNKKKLGQLSAQEELAWLERIQKTFRMNKEEQMELEIKLYNLKKQLHDEDVSALDKIGDAVTEALRNKYEQQKKAEQDRINESIESWKTWEDETCKAIQGQIDALDELEKQQESEEKRAEYEKKRKATELLLRFEKDGYQRKQLEKQLAQLDAEEQKRLDQEARDAERERLQKEMEAAKETASKQEEALKDQLDELDKTYDELTKDFALRAEAEKAIMNSTQQEIIDLIKSYAPEYDLAGQTIGEKLVDGFKTKTGGIIDYLDGLMKKVQDYQANIAYTANQAADKFWADRKQYEQQLAASAAPPVMKASSPVVNMTVEINQPVQSPIEMRRQLEKVAQQIGRQLGG